MEKEEYELVYMTGEYKRIYLKSYQKIIRKIELTREQMQSMNVLIKSVSSQKLSFTPSSHRKRDLSDYIIQLEELSQDLEKELEHLLQLANQIHKNIKSLNGYEGKVLLYRYIGGYSMNGIRTKLHYSISQIKRWDASGVEKIGITKEEWKSIADFLGLYER